MSKHKKIRFIIHYVKPTALLFKIRDLTLHNIHIVLQPVDKQYLRENGGQLPISFFIFVRFIFSWQ